MNLKKKALLNGVTGGLDYTTRLIITFVLNPIILSSLGSYMFGVWKILGQLNSYMATGDLRAATSLKWIVSKERTVKTNDELSKIYSTSVYSFLVLLPIYIMVGIIIVYIAPSFTKASLGEIALVRNTSAVLVLTFILAQFFFLYESLLQAVNLAYKRIGLRSIILLIGGLANIVILRLGYSIFEMAIVHMCTIIANGIAMYWIAKQNIDWIRIIKTKLSDIKSFTALSVQYTLQKLANLINISSDIILLGYLVGPKYVAQYTFTIFAMFGIKGIVQIISTAVIPGIGRFYGEGNFQKVFDIRNQLIELKRMLLTICAVVICLFNESFIYLWTKDASQFSSSLDNYLISLIVILRVIAVVDKSFINITLKIKKQIGVSLITAVFTIVMGFSFIPVFKTLGLLLVLLAAAIVEMLLNALILQKELISYKLLKDLFFSKSFILSNIILFAAYLLSHNITTIESWLELGLYSLIASVSTMFFYWFVILDKEKQKWIHKTLISAIKK